MSTPSAILLLMLLGVVLVVILGPLNAVARLRVRGAGERASLETAREAKYREIRDAELDFKMGKLSAEDYEAIDADLRKDALAILNEIEALDARSGEFLEQHDRVQDEQDREEDRPAVEVALDERAAAERAGAAADAEGPRQP